MEPELLYEIRGTAAWLTLNREARRNAISQEMMGEIMSRLDQADADPAVRALCFTGAGEKAFCSGADLASAL